MQTAYRIALADPPLIEMSQARHQPRQEGRQRRVTQTHGRLAHRSAFNSRLSGVERDAPAASSLAPFDAIRLTQPVATPTGRPAAASPDRRTSSYLTAGSSFAPSRLCEATPSTTSGETTSSPWAAPAMSVRAASCSSQRGTPPDHECSRVTARGVKIRSRHPAAASLVVEIGLRLRPRQPLQADRQRPGARRNRRSRRSAPDRPGSARPASAPRLPIVQERGEVAASCAAIQVVVPAVDHEDDLRPSRVAERTTAPDALQTPSRSRPDGEAQPQAVGEQAEQLLDRRMAHGPGRCVGAGRGSLRSPADDRGLPQARLGEERGEPLPPLDRIDQSRQRPHHVRAARHTANAIPRKGSRSSPQCRSHTRSSLHELGTAPARPSGFRRRDSRSTTNSGIVTSRYP